MTTEQDHALSIEKLRSVTAIVCSVLGHANMFQQEIPTLIQTVSIGIDNIMSGKAAIDVTKREPAVPIKKSITPDYLICLEDGTQLKMLKRFLRSRYNLSPDQYRAKWGLPANYPMVAPNYAAIRSQFAKDNGLGKTRPAAKAKKR